MRHLPGGAKRGALITVRYKGHVNAAAGLRRCGGFRADVKVTNTGSTALDGNAAPRGFTLNGAACAT